MRGVKGRNMLGSRSFVGDGSPKCLCQFINPTTTAATFVSTRFADPFLQYNILNNTLGSGLVETLGGSVLPRGPPLVTNTFLDNAVGLSPYRSILLAMSTACMVKQNFTTLAIQQEEMTPIFGAQVGAFNAICNSINSLLFIASQTSASVNGEHFPQSPLILGSTLFASGLFIETFSEIQRALWKRDPANKGKVYDQGLFGLSRHINYFGYTLWRTGYSMAAGGFTWSAVTAGFFAFTFIKMSIPEIQGYLEKRVRCIARIAPSSNMLMYRSTVHSLRRTSRRCRTRIYPMFTERAIPLVLLGAGVAIRFLSLLFDVAIYSVHQSQMLYTKLRFLCFSVRGGLIFPGCPSFLL